jgi:hypothetical protein
MSLVMQGRALPLSQACVCCREPLILVKMGYVQLSTLKPQIQMGPGCPTNIRDLPGRILKDCTPPY